MPSLAFLHERRLPRLTYHKRVWAYRAVIGVVAALAIWMWLGVSGYGEDGVSRSLYFGESFNGFVASHYLRVETVTATNTTHYHLRPGYLVLHLALTTAMLVVVFRLPRWLAKRWPPALREWCDRCGYDRRGRLEGPCPECGHRALGATVSDG